MFQSTHSLRSATMGYTARGAFGLVSIHALLAECDRFRNPVPRPVCRFNPRTPCGVRLVRASDSSGGQSFNPRTPCGVRLHIQKVKLRPNRFQSTHSLRSATR